MMLPMLALGAVLAQALRALLLHCDTESGPVLVDARTALLDGNVNHVLKWVPASDDGEVKAAFDAAHAAKTHDSERNFFETLVRLHRASEGAEYTGLKPDGSPQPIVVTDGDLALKSGNFDDVAALIDPAFAAQAQVKFDETCAAGKHDVNDLAAARTYVARYVDYIHFILAHATADGKELA